MNSMAKQFGLTTVLKIVQDSISTVATNTSDTKIRMHPRLLKTEPF